MLSYLHFYCIKKYIEVYNINDTKVQTEQLNSVIVNIYYRYLLVSCIVSRSRYNGYRCIQLISTSFYMNKVQPWPMVNTQILLGGMHEIYSKMAINAASKDIRVKG